MLSRNKYTQESEESCPIIKKNNPKKKYNNHPCDMIFCALLHSNHTRPYVGLPKSSKKK